MAVKDLKIVVTGGMGYIGSHVCKALVDAGAQVISVDRDHNDKNIIDGVEYIYADYADEEVWHSVAVDPVNTERFGKLDGIVHCAGSSDVRESVDNPSEYYNNNVVKTIKMLDCIKELDRKPFIVFCSSGSVYRKSPRFDLKESDQLSPQSPYAQTKVMIENILSDYKEAYGIDYIALRFFNAAGLNVWDDTLAFKKEDEHIIPQLFKAYKYKKPFKLYGSDFNTHDGTCIRDYIHVCDVSNAIVLCCERLIKEDATHYEVYNIGSGYGYTNLEVVEMFSKVVGYVDVIERPRRSGDSPMLVADPSRFIYDFIDQRTKWSDLQTIIKSARRNYE